MSMIAALAAEGGGLPMPPESYGLMALVFFGLLLGVTWTFRNTAQKHVPPSQTHGDTTPGHGTVERHH